MKLRNAFISVSLVLGAICSGSEFAKAANFTSNISFTQPTNDVILNSITQNGTTFNDFSFVNRTIIQYNTPRTNDPNSGAASTDRGDNVFTPQLPQETPAPDAITAFLATDNLNNIVDTEDSGAFTLDVFFDQQIRQDGLGLDSLFFWERGMNSDLGIQALDANGNLIGNFTKISQTRNNFAGFQIDTTEIGAAQNVGSWGVNLDTLGVSQLSGLRLTADSSFNGPDFKVIARVSTIPEPATLLGLGAVAGMAFFSRRQKVFKKS